MNKIYKIEFDNYIYIGSTKQKYLSQRQGRHNENLKKNPNQLLYKKAIECNVNKLICELICECSEEERFRLENEYIKNTDKISLNMRLANLSEEERKERRLIQNKKSYHKNKHKYDKRTEYKRLWWEQNKLKNQKK